MAQGIFHGRFRWIYSVAKVITLYICTYFVFYFWPQFLGRVVLPDYSAQMQVIAGSFLTPLGLLFVGGYFGKKSFAVHLLILVAAVVVTWLTWPDDLQMTPPALHDRLSPFMMGAFAVGALLSCRMELKVAPVDE